MQKVHYRISENKHFKVSCEDCNHACMEMGNLAASPIHAISIVYTWSNLDKDTEKVSH